MVWVKTPLGGSLNHKLRRTRYSTWRVTDIFELVVSEEWFIGICGVGKRDFDSRFGQVRSV